ncbi:unnamed protein product [Rotaria socialis]|uniref:Uncharacterized protein n=1 Tax=Rotaria socialis TaxID=392032 RepID=A0A817ZY75_9BILA|nr:unnamed protein product [Rotaria socialis]CAF4849623.1 unnamed protein product [Rotaria socialis]
MKPMLLVVELLSLIFITSVSHFLGGTITWRLLSASATGTPVDINITQTYSWSYSSISCTTAMIASSQLIPVPTYTGLTTATLNYNTNCGAGSLGYVAPNIIPYCMDSSTAIGTTISQRSDIVTLAAGDDFSAAFQSNAWCTLATSTGAVWPISTRMNVNPRSDNGLYENVPVTTIMSPILIPVSQTIAINVFVADADVVDECGGVYPPSSLPPGTVIYLKCTILITGQIVGDWFAVALTVEDFINSSSIDPLSSVLVQFLVQVVSQASSTSPPTIIGEFSQQSCTLILFGQTFVSQLIVMNNCGSSVTIIDMTT